MSEAGEPAAKRAKTVSRLGEALKEMSPEHASVVAAALLYSRMPVNDSHRLSQDELKESHDAWDKAMYEFCSKHLNPFSSHSYEVKTAVVQTREQKESTYFKLLREYLYSS